MANDKFEWIPFYEELADKLGEFKTDRGSLLDKIRNVYQRIGIKFPTLDEGDVIDVDPFTIFGLFNKGITDGNRIKIISAIKEEFAISSKVPHFFGGVPVLDNRNATFYAFKSKRGKHDIEWLWDVYIAAIDYADDAGDDEETRDVFVECYDRVRPIPYLKWKLTMGLYWIRPSRFVNLDSRNRWFLGERAMLGDRCSKAISSLGDRSPEAAKYLSICDLCDSEIQSGRYEYGNFAELSLSSWEESQRVNKEKKAAQASREGDSSPASVDGRGNTLDFLLDVYLSDEEIESIMAMLNRKKNLILQGAPGTGKTFVAKRIAYALMGEKDDDRVEVVQFHQNTTYDDFVFGYRPNEEGGFTKVPGRFVSFCRKAQVRSDENFYFIIDEINRANISKVFGELLMLVESSHRGDSVILPTSRERFYVPGNLYIIGMMNTADRSLALIDYALRRRFAFFEMKPALDNPLFRERVNAFGHRLPQLVDAVKSLNKQIAVDPSLGRGFCIGHSYFCLDEGDLGESDPQDVVRSIVEYELKPLLEEYWFDNPKKVEDEVDKLDQAIGKKA